jgi:hypothetical protein
MKGTIAASVKGGKIQTETLTTWPALTNFIAAFTFLSTVID